MRWYTNGATDRFRANRVYRYKVQTTYAGVVQAIAELQHHGRVLYQAQNQPGTDPRQNKMIALLIWLPAASVVDRGDTLGVLYGTLRSRTSTVVLKTEAAQISAGARDNMWAEAGSHPAAALSISGFESLSGLTWSEQVTQSARGTAAHTRDATNAAIDAARGAADSIGDAVGDVGAGISNTWTYTKIALALVGVGAAFVILKNGAKI
jgi:hypothetical protein